MAQALRTDPALVLLSIGSYNVHRCIGTDRQCDPARVARVVAELQVDVLALQEVDCGYHRAGDDQIATLAEALGMHAVAGPTMHRASGTYGNALLTRLPAATVRHVDLSVACREPRGAIDADLEIEGHPVRMVVAHLGLRGFERVRQVEEILRSVRSAPQGKVTVVAGDLNEWRPNDRSLQPLHVRFGRSRVRTFPSWRPLFSFDRILVEPQDRVRSFDVHDSPLARRASDHLPVKAVVEL
jgi:endonuclease/exonuclease/phosphatase family metal-dependent hydrolase